jgi:hypothetical protein
VFADVELHPVNRTRLDALRRYRDPRFQAINRDPRAMGIDTHRQTKKLERLVTLCALDMNFRAVTDDMRFSGIVKMTANANVSFEIHVSAGLFCDPFHPPFL